MPSPLYQQFNQAPQNNFAQMLAQFKQNPMAMLAQRYNSFSVSVENTSTISINMQNANLVVERVA